MKQKVNRLALRGLLYSSATGEAASVDDGEHTWQEVEPRTEGGQMFYWLFNEGGPWTQSNAPASAFRVNGVVDPSVGDAKISIGAIKSRFR